MEDINRKRFELELQLAAERGMDVEAKIHLIEWLLQEVERDVQQDNKYKNNS
tara:strand:+ start:335 stop:490 length:156 start_codon:yes stop_codon:yes gene_type:complete